MTAVNEGIRCCVYVHDQQQFQPNLYFGWQILGQRYRAHLGADFDHVQR